MEVAHMRLRGVEGKTYFEWTSGQGTELVGAYNVKDWIKRLRGDVDRVKMGKVTAVMVREQRLRLAEYLETVLSEVGVPDTK